MGRGACASEGSRSAGACGREASSVCGSGWDDGANRASVDACRVQDRGGGRAGGGDGVDHVDGARLGGCGVDCRVDILGAGEGDEGGEEEEQVCEGELTHGDGVTTSGCFLLFLLVGFGRVFARRGAMRTDEAAKGEGARQCLCDLRQSSNGSVSDGEEQVRA